MTAFWQMIGKKGLKKKIFLKIQSNGNFQNECMYAAHHFTLQVNTEHNLESLTVNVNVSSTLYNGWTS